VSKRDILSSSIRIKADALFKAKRFDEATVLFQQICKQDPRDADAWFKLGITNAHLGNLEESVKCIQSAIALRPDVWEAHFNLGNTLLQLGEIDKAEASYRKTIRLNPGLPQAHINLGNTLKARGKLIEALACNSRALEIKPDYSLAYFNMGDILYQMGRLEEAETSYRQALAIKPDDALAYVNMGNTLYQMGRLREAENSYRQALAIDSANPRALQSLANMQFSQGNFDNALHNFQQLEKLYPGRIDIPFIKAEMLEKQGRLDEAYNIIKPLIDQDKENAKTAQLFASICLHLGHRKEAIAMLKRVLSDQDATITDADRVSVHFRLGELYDAERDYDRAFQHIRSANELKRMEFDGDAYSASVDKLIETFNTRNLSTLPRASNNSDRTVFIVGMPRSGTTLVEQILSCHPEVFGAGELEHIHLAIDNLPKMVTSQKPYPDCLAELTQESLDELAQTYLDHMAQLATHEHYVINKMPELFQHLGFIAMLFPKARIIHCTRDPLDTCLSLYFGNFRGLGVRYCYRQEDLGHYYRNYERLMQHWNAVLDIPIMNVSYEALIADQEGMTRRLLDFLELEWNDACLRFYENKRFVNTSSYNQVRQPINSRSIGRWKHYERYLEPLKISLLEPPFGKRTDQC
jgi:tetratricopeptide (TPR) repeat protein